MKHLFLLCIIAVNPPLMFGAVTSWAVSTPPQKTIESSFKPLSDNVLGHVSEFLSPKERISFKLISKECLRAIDFITKRLHIMNFRTMHISNLIERCPCLETLTCHKFNDDQLEAIITARESLDDKQDLNSLTSVSFKDCDLSDTLLIRFIQTCPNLQRLIWNSEFSNWSILLTPATDSRTILCKNITDYELNIITKLFPNPTSIDLGFCNITNAGLKELAKNCNNLTSINLRRCNVTDTGLLELAKNGPNLTSINLYKCNITDNGLLGLAKNCPKLISINLGCCNITNDGLLELAKNCLNLTSIDLLGCNITNDGLLGLAKNCPKLISISFYECRKITRLELKYLTENYPKLILNSDMY